MGVELRRRNCNKSVTRTRSVPTSRLITYHDADTVETKVVPSTIVGEKKSPAEGVDCETSEKFHGIYASGSS